MIDPSAFTPPYDHHLCRGLTTVGCDLTLYSTRADYYLWDGDTPYDRVEYFYRHTDALYRDRDGMPGRAAVKGLEHLVDMTRFVRKARACDPDVVHVQWAPVPVVDRWFFRALAQIAPLVFTVHDTTPFHDASTSVLQLLDADVVYDEADQLIVHTEGSRDELVDQGISPDDISVIPHGVLEYPDETAASGRNERSAGANEDDSQTILFFGTIKPYKRIDVLLEAFALLPSETRATTELLVAGNPKMDVEPLHRQAADLGIQSSVRWDLRFVPDPEVPVLFDAADLVVFPYDDIDQSGSLLTAVQYETPIVATRIAGFAEVLTDGEHGFLVPPDSPSALADAMDRVVTDPELAEQMSKNVGDLVESIPSWKSIAHSTRGVYESLCFDLADNR
ncbi:MULTISPECIES: glycosyltransferase family 4 protein [Halobacterium]|uniref:glycosyltransferase family 4 protein n=1 Tax=Halobacterium TaxID=2239 RepID=UPI0019652011|nr:MULTISPECIES: glycosyltransferase family 4 protein [Halobacterium]MCF2164673.1 glycosyltransferase family 4 protein [Halobacterium salinarum]MCF2166881.1 glycosyltransferase family 4 protein [Halobacterium salinarum]QRY22779.1 glycosyltransferase family 4 protein [Halobacterium sp. GSL-19]WJK64085.2 glycosyltransferase family 4 protein [Halobacterium salinarum]